MKTQHLILCLCGLLLLACNSGKILSEENKKTTENIVIPENSMVAIYKYSDAAVHPEYFRSYEIITQPDKLILTVSGIREVISTVEQQISIEEYQAILAKLQECKLYYDTSCKEIPSDGCAGGHEESFSYAAGKTAYLAQAYFCGGRRYGTSCGDLPAMGAYLRGFFTDFEKLLMRKE